MIIYLYIYIHNYTHIIYIELYLYDYTCIYIYKDDDFAPSLCLANLGCSPPAQPRCGAGPEPAEPPEPPAGPEHRTSPPAKVGMVRADGWFLAIFLAIFILFQVKSGDILAFFVDLGFIATVS